MGGEEFEGDGKDLLVFFILILLLLGQPVLRIAGCTSHGHSHRQVTGQVTVTTSKQVEGFISHDQQTETKNNQNPNTEQTNGNDKTLAGEQHTTENDLLLLLLLLSLSLSL